MIGLPDQWKLHPSAYLIRKAGKPMKNPGCWMVGAVLACLSTGLCAKDASNCDRLDLAMGATASDDAQADVVKGILSGLGPTPAACSFSAGLKGTRSANCNWVFPFRSDEAHSGFSHMLAVLSACADPAFAIETDQPVNHPDTYDARILRIGDNEVGLSIKDKSEFQQTYVFLRLTPTRRD